MTKIILAAALFSLALPVASFAACTQSDAMEKMSETSDLLGDKVASKPEAASKLMQEMGDIMGTGTVTEATCTKLDDLKARAKKL